jgi:hypothetical protein
MGRLQKSISQRAAKRAGRWFLVLFFSIFFLVGSGLSYAFFIGPMLKIKAAESWIETPCVIVSSQVGVHRGSKSTTYSVQIVYTYQVNGQSYQSNRYDFFEGSSSGYDSKEAIVNRYRPGEQTVCYVNPNDPNDAVLERGFTNELYFGLIPLVFALVGGGGLLFTLRGARSKTEQLPASTWQPTIRDVSDKFAALGFAPSSGSVVLEANVSPKGKLIGITAFSLVWNGIVSVFVWQAVQSWQQGEPEWGLTLFMIPFVLVGLGSVVAVVYYFLALFNPRPMLTISSASVELGGTLDLQWQMFGRAHLIERLRIYLEGREEARYRRGTRTYTDRNTFATVEIVDTPSHSQVFAGQTRFTIPRDTMHSFTSSNNKIIWMLHLSGDIKRWPNIKEEFEIVIRPMSRSQSW